MHVRESAPGPAGSGRVAREREGVPRDGRGLPRRHVARERAGGLLLRQGRARGDAAARSAASCSSPARRASLRGRAKFGGFAQAKAALRALAQSAAREFGPQGIHVAHVVVDGAIDGDRINTFLPRLKQQRGADGLLDPDAIAENFWQLYRQPRSAWTHEIDVRPWVEPW